MWANRNINRFFVKVQQTHNLNNDRINIENFSGNFRKSTSLVPVYQSGQKVNHNSCINLVLKWVPKNSSFEQDQFLTYFVLFQKCVVTNSYLDLHHSQGGIKFASQISILLNLQFESILYSLQLSYIVCQYQCTQALKQCAHKLQRKNGLHIRGTQLLLIKNSNLTFLSFKIS